jgi:hypothetical protein
VDGAAPRPVIGLFGAFDTGELGEVALRRVIETEIARRRPDIDLVAIAPFGAERPLPSDDGRPAQPLGSDAAGSLRSLDALIIAGDVLGDDAQWAGRYPAPVEEMSTRGVGLLVLSGKRDGVVSVPVTWFAAGPVGSEPDVTRLEGKDVWARDLATQQQLGGTAVQSGDPILLAGRVFAPEVLRRRTDLLRLCGAIPAGRLLVIELGSSGDASSARDDLESALAAALRSDPKLSVVVMTLDPTRPSALHALRVPGLIAERVHRLPEWVGLDDIAAVITSAAAVVAATPAGAHLAAGLGVPVAAMDTGEDGRLDPAITVLAGDVTPAIAALLAGKQMVNIDAAVQTLDGAFAELAERLPRKAGSPHRAVAAGEQSSLAILQQRLVDERAALQAELSRMQAELDHLRASPEHRIARPIREGYRRWQRRRT